MHRPPMPDMNPEELEKMLEAMLKGAGGGGDGEVCMNLCLASHVCCVLHAHTLAYAAMRLCLYRGRAGRARW